LVGKPLAVKDVERLEDPDQIRNAYQPVLVKSSDLGPFCRAPLERIVGAIGDAVEKLARVSR